EALERHLVLREVDPLLALELGDHPVDDRLVEVVAAEVVVPVRRLDLEDALAELEHRDVERPAAEVEDENRLVLALLVEPVRERGRGRLVDDPEDVEAGDLAGVLGRLALGVVEVGGHGDHRVVDRLAEIGLGVRLQLLEDHRADLRRRVVLAGGLDAGVSVRTFHDFVRDDLHLLRDLAELALHEALDRDDRVLRLRHLLPLPTKRRTAVAEPRIGAYAKLLVERSPSVQPGWQVWINSSALGRPLVEEVVRLIARRGAYPLVRIGGAAMEDIPFEEVWALE